MTDAMDPNDEDWFMILLGPWGREDQPEGDPELTGVPTTLVRELREHAPTWRSLDITDDDTVGCYEDGRLRVGFEIADPEASVQLATLRVEVSEHNWQAAWADATDGITATTMSETTPRSEIVGGPITSADGTAEAAQILDWLRTQLQRPIERRSWRDGTTVTGTTWRFTDTGEPLVGSGYQPEPETADDVTTVRP